MYIWIRAVSFEFVDIEQAGNRGPVIVLPRGALREKADRRETKTFPQPGPLPLKVVLKIAPQAGEGKNFLDFMLVNIKLLKCKTTMRLKNALTL